MKVKPETLHYGVNEKPLLAITLLLGFEHIIILSVAFIFPILFITASHVPLDGAFHMIVSAPRMRLNGQNVMLKM